MLNPMYQLSLLKAPSRDLPERRAEPVRDIQLKQVPSRAPFETEADLVHARIEAAQAAA